MARRPLLRLVHLVLVIGLVWLSAACGDGSAAGVTYQPGQVQTALSSAGFSVAEGRGMKPLSGGRQLGWLDATAPDGTKLSLQFLEDADHAATELAAVNHQDVGFRGAVIGNILFFVAPSGHGVIPSAATEAVRRALKGS